jgi:hypothetical protein
MSLYHPIQTLPNPTIVPSDNILLNNTTEQSTTSTSLTQLKSTRVYYRGKIRTYFELCSELSEYQVQGQVYRNGDAVGTLRTTTSSTYVSFTEDIDNWFEGDYYQIYGAGNYYIEYGYIACYVRNQQIRGLLTTQKPVGLARF